MTSEEASALGTTRWASPPPGASWKAYALTLLAGDVGLVVAGKLIAHPLAVFAGLKLAPGLDPALAKAALIFASAPVITIYPLLGQVYGQAQLCSAALISGVALSFLTISTLLYFI